MLSQTQLGKITYTWKMFRKITLECARAGRGNYTRCWVLHGALTQGIFSIRSRQDVTGEMKIKEQFHAISPLPSSFTSVQRMSMTKNKQGLCSHLYEILKVFRVLGVVCSQKLLWQRTERMSEVQKARSM